MLDVYVHIFLVKLEKGSSSLHRLTWPSLKAAHANNHRGQEGEGSVKTFSTGTGVSGNGHSAFISGNWGASVQPISRAQESPKWQTHHIFYADDGYLRSSTCMKYLRETRALLISLVSSLAAIPALGPGLQQPRHPHPHRPPGRGRPHLGRASARGWLWVLSRYGPLPPSHRLCTLETISPSLDSTRG